MSEFVAVIMAGGRGQRFWPLSTEARPKQFLDLSKSGRTLIQSTFDRVLPLAGSADNVYVATAERYLDLVKQQLPDVPEENLLVEPVGRDSAPAIALASLTIHRRTGGAITGFFSSDHRIGDPDSFQRSVTDAIALARARQALVTIGITPDRPATGYGYIEHPLRDAVEQDRIDEVFPTLKKISIDYAVMEHTERAMVVPGDFDWDDIGDWVALERLLPKDDGIANTVVGKHVGMDAVGNIIYTEEPDDVVVTLGVENLVIAKRGNTILLVAKNRVQDIKKLLADERLVELATEG